MSKFYVALISQHSLSTGGIDDIHGWGTSPEAAIALANKHSGIFSSPRVETFGYAWAVYYEPSDGPEMFETLEAAEDFAEDREWRAGECSEALYNLLRDSKLTDDVDWDRDGRIYDVILDDDQSSHVDTIVSYTKECFDADGGDYTDIWSKEELDGQFDAFGQAGEYIDTYVLADYYDNDGKKGFYVDDEDVRDAVSDDMAVRYVACQRVAEDMRKRLSDARERAAEYGDGPYDAHLEIIRGHLNVIAERGAANL